MEKKTKQERVLGIIVFVAIILVSILIVFCVMFYLISNVFFPASMEYYEVPVEVLNKELSNGYDNKELSGTQVRSTLQQYIRSGEVTLVLLDSNTGNILATVGEKKLPADALIKRDGYYEIEYDKYIADNGLKHKTTIAEFNDPQSEVYIDRESNIKYNSYIIRLVENNSNEKVVGVVFEK